MTTVELTANAAGARRSERIDCWTRVLCVLFFCSGFPALIYQITWQRALFRIFGVNIESVTIVVTAFMLGLGLGSLAGGALSKRRDIPLLPLLATIELGPARSACCCCGFSISSAASPLLLQADGADHAQRRRAWREGAVGRAFPSRQAAIAGSRCPRPAT